MTKYEYVVTSCTDRDIVLVGKFDNEKDAFKAMIRDFVVFHNEMDALKDLYKAIKHMELSDKEYTVDEVIDAILSLLKTGGCDEIQEVPDSMSICAFEITTRACWSNLNKRDVTYDCKISIVEQKGLSTETTAEATSKSKENMTFFIGEESASGIFFDTWEDFIEHLHDVYSARMESGETQFNVTIEHSVEVPKTKKAVLFDEFARICRYFDPASKVNNGYGCQHPSQEEREERFEVIMTSDAFPNPEDAFAIWDNMEAEYYADTYGKVFTYPTEKEAKASLLKFMKYESVSSCGCCYCHSCPLGIEAEQEDKDNPEYSENIDWDGFCEDGEVCEGEYLLIDCGDDATGEQKDALNRWGSYRHRYD